jgi:hypothetical protein
MNMRLHKARQDSATSRIYHGVCALNFSADACNAAAANEQIALSDGVIVVHQEERAVFDENRLFHLAPKRIEAKRQKVKTKIASCLHLFAFDLLS